MAYHSPQVYAGKSAENKELCRVGLKAQPTSILYAMQMQPADVIVYAAKINFLQMLEL